MLATALLPLVFVSWRLITFNRDAMSAGQHAVQVEFVEGRARAVAAALDQAVDVTIGLAAGLEAGASNRVETISRDELAAAASRDGRIRALGVSMESAPEPVEYVADPKVQTLLAAAETGAAGDGPFVTGPKAVGPDGALVVGVAVRLRGGAGVVGVLASAVDVRQAFEQVIGAGKAERSLLDAGDTVVYVIDDAGIIVASRDAATIGQQKLRDDSLVREWITRPNEPGVITREFLADTGGESRNLLGSIATVRVPNGGRLGVVALSNRDLAFAPSNRVAVQTLWACAFAAFVALLVTLLFAWQIGGPLSELARGARAIANGDFSHRLKVRSHNEIGQLAEDFNRMAERLESNIDRMREAADTSRALFIGTVRGLAAAIDGKDPYTRGHSERVAEFSAAMAIELGLDEEEVEKIRIGGLMHDLGKLAIEDKILRKPAPLTDEEFEIMREHPERGTRIMSEIPQMREYIPGMRFHHEMVNGKGYPLGLFGEQIPLMARIVSVADTFDAMTTNRPYQKQMPIDVVFEKIRSMAGVRYDPSVVDALIAAYENGRIKLRLQKAPRPAPAPEDGNGP